MILTFADTVLLKAVGYRPTRQDWPQLIQLTRKAGTDMGMSAIVH
jgi:hypothetical protein